MSDRRTRRRYAHELYPHAKEGDTRDLATDVPYMYSRAIGFEVNGTGWFDIRDERTMMRMVQVCEARFTAFLADALLQGMAGQDAWDWATRNGWDETGDTAWERACTYGVPVYEIKPYPCGPEPDQHEHLGEPDAHGLRAVDFAKGKESECPDCTEPRP